MVAGSEGLQEMAQRATRPRPWIERLARLGYAVKGVVYFLIGLLAFQAAIGLGGQTTGMQGVLKALYERPFGQITLTLTAIGLIGYSLWRLTQAWLDPDHQDSQRPQRLVQRGGYVVSALIYGYVALEAVKLVFGFVGSETEQDASEFWTARLMAQPFGPWLVALVGFAIVATGLFQFAHGITARFRDELDLYKMTLAQRKWAIRSGRFGYSARAIIYIITGGFMVWAGIRFDPNEAVGTAEAMDKIAQQPFGAWLLAFMGLGFMAYATFAMMQSRFRRINLAENSPTNSS